MSTISTLRLNIKRKLTELFKAKFDVSGKHLKGTIFTGITFSKADFSHAVLDTVVFKNCNFEECSFEKATLINVAFNGCAHSFSKFNEAAMDSAEFNYSSLYMCEFKYANGAIALKANRASFTECAFGKAVMSNAEFKFTLLEKCNMEAADFSNLNSSYTHFDHCMMTMADFSMAKLSVTNFDQCQMPHTKFKSAHLEHVSTWFCNMTMASMYNAAIFSSVFSMSSIKNVLFNKAMIERCIFNACNIMSTVIQDARLISCVFYKGDISDVNFDSPDEIEGCMLNDLYSVSQCTMPSFNLNGTLFMTGVTCMTNCEDMCGGWRDSLIRGCPSDDEYIAWKFAHLVDGDTPAGNETYKTKNVLVKLRIPKDAKRACNGSSAKCRADKAEVLDIVDNAGNHYKRAVAHFNPSFIYTVGETVTSDFGSDWNVECGAGIHHFLTRRAAEEFAKQY